VGIGTSTPAYKLDVSGSGVRFGDQYKLTYSSANGGTLYHSGALLYVGTPDNKIQFVQGSVTDIIANNKTVLRAYPSQYNCVAIGGAFNPTETLEVGGTKGSLKVNGNSYFLDTVLVSGSQGNIELDNSGASIKFDRNADNYIYASGSTASLKFGVGSNVEFVTLRYTDRMGVGTTDPQATLHVNGDLIAGASTSAGLWFDKASDRLRISGQLVLEKSGANVYVGYNATNLIFRTNNSEAARFTDNGRLGIGTTSVAYPLVVSRTGSNIVASFEGNENTYVRIARTGATQPGEAQLRVTNNGNLNISSDSNISLTTGGVSGTTRLYVRNNDGNVGIGTTTPAEKLTVEGNISGSGNLTVAGAIEGASKSFNIPHPTQPGKKLIYGSLEGPEHGVYARGQVEGNVIELPEEWTGLVDDTTITVQLTSIGSHQNLYVADIKDNKVFIKNGNTFSSKIKAFYFIQAMRKDIDKLQTVR